MRRRIAAIAAAILLCSAEIAGVAAGEVADWPAWRGPDNSGAVDCGAEMVDSLDQAKLAWKSDPVGYSGCMYPGKHAGTGYCDPIIAGGRVYLYWFERSGAQRVEWEWQNHSQTRGLKSLLDPAEVYGSRGCGYPKDPKEMAELQSHFNADDVIVCLDDRTGKTLWKRVFHERGFNHRKVYSPLCVPCVRDGRLYALGSAGRVYALDAVTGKTLWENDIGLAASRFEEMRELCARTKVRAVDPVGCNTAFVAADGVVVVGDSSKEDAEGGSTKAVGVVAYEAATGKRLWTMADAIPWNGMANTWRHDGKEYFLTVSQAMRLIEPQTGRIVWQIGGAQDRISDGVAAAISGECVVVNKNAAKVVGGGREGDRGPSCYRLSLEGAKMVWSLPIDDCPGITLIAPVIHRQHAYVPMKGGVACVELATGKVVGERLAGFGSAYAGYVVADGLIFQLARPLNVAKTFPELAKLEGTLPGGADVGEIQTPSVANGRVYWRGRHNVWCYDFRKNGPADVPTAPLPAARDLSGIAGDPARLAQAIEKEAWPTRAAAAEHLRALGVKAQPASGALVKLLLAAVAAKDWGDVDLLLDALLAIDRAAAKPAAPELAKLLEAKDELTVRLGCHALSLMGAEAVGAVPALGKLLEPDQPESAALAARALGRIGPGANAAIPALLKCLEAKDQQLKYESAKALCHLAPAEPAARAATIEALLAHPWFIAATDGNGVPPRLKSYRAVALSLLGKDAGPALLERAKKAADAGEYANVCDLASAAYILDPKSAPDYLPVLAEAPKKKAGVKKPLAGGSNGQALKLTELDLKGTINLRDPRGLGVAKAQTAPKKAAGE